MSDMARRITFAEWDQRYTELRAGGLREPDYGGPLRQHVEDGDRRLLKLRMDIRRLRCGFGISFFRKRTPRRRTWLRQEARRTMKDLGTVPVMAYSLGNLVAFYPGWRVVAPVLAGGR